MVSKIIKGIRNPTAAVHYLKHRLQYARLRLVNGDPESIAFYKSIQDAKIREGEAYSRDQGIGEAQMAFLRRRGLARDDDLLDIGCGDLRGGQYMIDYLRAGSYTGIDISEEAIAAARENVESWDDTPTVTLLVNDDLRFAKFDDDTFDWMFANSVLTHLPESPIRECFGHLGRVLRADGVATLSFREPANTEPAKIRTNTISMSNIYEYPFDTLSSWASEYDLTATEDGYDEHPREDMRMLILRPKPGR